LESDDDPKRFDLYAGNCPRKSECMPAWPMANRTHFSLYETTTEGTPLSPVFPSISELAQWCSKNIPLWNGNFGPVYQWEAELRSVFAPARLHGFDAGEREP
jgi:hypothetical protein